MVMQIAIIGAGAIGSIVAGMLKKQGVDTLLIGKEEQVAKIAREGLVIRGGDWQETIALRVATCLEQEYDLVIFATKTQDLESAYQKNHEYLEPSYVLMIQNGVQGSNMLSCHYDCEKMISSIIMFGATYTQPGHVTYNFSGDWIIGKPYAANNYIVEEIAGILGKAFSLVITDNIMGMKWLKLFINFNNCIPALIGKSIQETFADIDLCHLSIRLLREGIDIIDQAGIDLVPMPQFPVERITSLLSMPEEQAARILQQTMTGLSKEPLYGSILQSILRGKKSEIDFINGEVDQVAGSIQAQAPLNRKVVNMVHQVERTGVFFPVDRVKSEFALKF